MLRGRGGRESGQQPLRERRTTHTAAETGTHPHSPQPLTQADEADCAGVLPAAAEKGARGRYARVRRTGGRGCGGVGGRRSAGGVPAGAPAGKGGGCCGLRRPFSSGKARQRSAPQRSLRCRRRSSLLSPRFFFPQLAAKGGGLRRPALHLSPPLSPGRLAD